MQKNSAIKKSLVVFLIFTLTFSNFALVTKSYATTIFDTVFFGSSNTESKNVVFKAYFEDDIERPPSTIGISAINDSVNLSLDLEVRNTGYLKNAQIQIKEKREPPWLNFKIEGKLDELDYVKNFENNTLTLKQINHNSQLNLKLPLTYNQEEYIEPSKLSKDFDVILTGTYVNGKAKEIEISKVITLNLTWLDKREVKLSSEVTKYIPYLIDGKNGVILQTLIKVDSTAEKSGAVKSTNLEIEVPKIEGADISKVNVIAKSTLGTDGKNAEQVDFSENNWNLENGILKITKENQAKFVKDEIKNEENTLLEENENVEEKEKYFSLSGADEYLITYIFENVTSTDQTLKSNVKATVTTFGREEIENKSKQEFEYKLSEQIGDIVTYEVQNDTKSVSKGYMYINSKNENSLYETEYNSKAILNISYKDIVEEIYVNDLTNNYVDKYEQKHELSDISYKSISISKSNFEKLLGEDGIVEILSQDEKSIAKFTKDIEPDENGNLVYNFDEYKINNIKIKTSKPEQEGNLIFSISKVQNQTEYDKSKYATFDYMEINSKAEVKYKNVENLIDASKIETKIKLEDTTTKADLELSTTSILTLEKADVVMKIKLNNKDITSDIYGNSTFEILLPEYIENIEITDYNMIYGEGLNLSNVETLYNEQGNIIIKVTIEGLQTNLSSGTITSGTNIILNSKITVNKYTPLMEKEIELKVTNSEATNYINEGISKTKITYSAPTGVVAINTIKNYDGNGNEVTSIKQGTQKATISTYSNLTMELIVMNNTPNKISNIIILGRVPFEENKDVVEDELEITTSPQITSRIISDSNNYTNFKIYYSAKDEPTKDLNDSSNGWTEEIDLRDIKSFLIIPEATDYEMEASEKLKFVYEFNIPESENFNNDIYTNFKVYYTSDSELANKEDVSVPDTIYLTPVSKPNLEPEQTGELEQNTKTEDLIEVADIEKPKLEDEKNSKLENEDNSKLEDEEKLKLEDEEISKLEDEENLKLEDEENSKLQDEEQLKLEDDENQIPEENDIVDNIPKLENEELKITGCVWIDENENGIRNKNEKLKPDTKVILVDSDTGIIKDTVTTDSTGKYEFKELTSKNYFVLFEYDVSKYRLTTYQKSGISKSNNSDVISTQFEQDGKLIDGAVTDVIAITDESVSNIDMGLIIEDTFDLQLTQKVSKITIQNESGTTIKEYNDLNFAKTEIAEKYLASSTAYIEYTIMVENKGDVEGYAKTIVDYIPEGLEFDSNINPDWYTGADGNLYTKALVDRPLSKGEKAKLKLILTKKMTEENTGMFNNTAEIIEDYNVYGLSNINSKAGNKIELQNDFGSADVIISAKTGEVFIYTSIIFTTTLLGGIAMFIIISKLKIKKRKEGGV